MFEDARFYDWRFDELTIHFSTTITVYPIYTNLQNTLTNAQAVFWAVPHLLIHFEVNTLDVSGIYSYKPRAY